MRAIRMLFGGEKNGPDDGGRYGSVGESSGGVADAGDDLSGSRCLIPGTGTLSSDSTSSSRSSVLIDDMDEGGFVNQDVYQRQPLIHDSLAAQTNGGFKDVNGSFYNKNGCVASNGMIKIAMPSPCREEPRFPKEKMKTFLAFIFLFLNWILTTLSLALTHERVPNSAPSLPDITLDSVAYHKWGLEVSEILILVTVYSCVVVVIFHKHRFIIFRRIFFIMGLLYFYRSITMYVTVLPMADHTYFCSPKANTTGIVLVMKRVIQLMSGFGLSMNGQHTFCGDFIYSGHTMCLVMAYLIVREYTPRRWWLLHWLFALLATVGIAMILISRSHYTIDCIVAYYIATRIFYIYHTLAHNQNLKEGGSHNFLDRLWWYQMFYYFEKNVQGVVPRHYEWPLPWPRRWSSKNPQRTS